MNNITFMTAQELAIAIRQRQVSAVEVLEAYLAQITQHNPTLNAIVTLDEDGARHRAEAADAALARGDVWGPLHGLPITLEDIHATADIRSTCGGYPQLATNIPTHDSFVVTRLRATGAIILGKTNGPTIWENSIFPRTNNPWDLKRTPGGSSSGPAAALAGGLTPLDIGGDSTGSITIPTHYCGIFGMRPTQHRVSVADAFILLDPTRKFRTLTVFGPMARSVVDLRLALQIISGPNWQDSEVPPLPWQEVPPLALQDLRIAYTSTFPQTKVAHDIRIAVESFAQELAGLDVHIEQALPEIDLAQQARLCNELFGLMAGAFAPPSADSHPASLDAYLLALHKRDAFIARWEEFFARWDALLCPADWITAPLQAETETIVDGEVIPEGQGIHPGNVFPLTGHPVVVIPLTKDRNGLPIGVQVIGRRWNDERLLAIAEVLSEVTGGFQRPPGY
jgi:amidase